MPQDADRCLNALSLSTVASATWMAVRQNVEYNKELLERLYFKDSTCQRLEPPNGRYNTTTSCAPSAHAHQLVQRLAPVGHRCSNGAGSKLVRHRRSCCGARGVLSPPATTRELAGLGGRCRCRDCSCRCTQLLASQGARRPSCPAATGRTAIDLSSRSGEMGASAPQPEAVRRQAGRRKIVTLQRSACRLHPHIPASQRTCRPA